MLIHNARIERETESANGWGQEGRHVGIVSRGANLVFLSVLFWTNVDLDAYGTVRLNYSSLFVFAVERYPESVVELHGVAIFVEHPRMLFIWLHHVGLVVVLVDAKGSLGQDYVVESLG